METLKFDIRIKSPAKKVYDTMLGKETYKQWTTAFNPSSDFEGSWDKGSQILFTGVEENGKKGGMVSRIEENDPGRFVSIQHVGMLDGDKHITEGPMVEGWAGAFENYSFSEENGETLVSVSVDTKEEYAGYFNDTWPKALEKLKELSEA